MTTTPPSEATPSLWNPTAAACWSLLFTPAFGAFLHARNAQALGRSVEAGANRMWIWVTIGYLAITVVGDFVISLPEIIYRGAALGLLCGWFFSVGRKQINYVADELPSGYTRKSWTGPLVVGMISVIGFLVIDFALQ